jgi:nucleoside-diphosphate-sugar epimerase
MNVLVTGTDGYLGSLLAPVLMRQGFDVTGVDTG